MALQLGRIVFTLFIWLYALIYYLEVMELEDSSEWMTVAAVFWLFTLFAIFELFFLLRTLLAEKDRKIAINRQILVRIARDSKTQLMLLTVIYLFLVPFLGFYLASFLAFCGFSFVLGARKIIWVVLGGILVSLIIYVIFTIFLKLVLPSGILF